MPIENKQSRSIATAAIHVTRSGSQSIATAAIHVTRSGNTIVGMSATVVQVDPDSGGARLHGAGVAGGR